MKKLYEATARRSEDEFGSGNRSFVLMATGLDESTRKARRLLSEVFKGYADSETFILCGIEEDRIVEG